MNGAAQAQVKALDEQIALSQIAVLKARAPKAQPQADNKGNAANDNAEAATRRSSVSESPDRSVEKVREDLEAIDQLEVRPHRSGPH